MGKCDSIYYEIFVRICWVTCCVLGLLALDTHGAERGTKKGNEE
jgi:hypothetical protein